MSLFEGFKRGSGGKYVMTEEGLVKVSDQCLTNDAGFNGPVWFPKGGHGYFDKAAQRYFDTKQEKKAWLKANNMVSAGSDEKKWKGAEAGLGRRIYSYSGMDRSKRSYKY